MINRRAAIRAVKRGLLAVFLLLGISSVSQAGPIGVPVDPYPSIVGGFITSTYNATTGAFAANGWALTLDTGGGKLGITTTFKLLATIENTGVARNGTLTVGSATAPLLFSTNLLQFGFNAVSGGALEFLFAPIAGSYIPNIYLAEKPLDVLLTGLGTGFPGAFTTSWSSSSNTVEIKEDGPLEPSPAPEPSTLLVMLAGAGGLYGGLRKRVGAPASNV
jgi:hypothetical protein